MGNSNRIFRGPERAPGSQNKALRKRDQAGLGHAPGQLSLGSG
jgi:hypothetical protein